MTPQDLQDALFNQAMAIINRTFRWVEGDYRFDSILPLDLDRENFPPIPVDTVLMEAARIMDEWPEVQRRLPDTRVPLAKTAAGRMLQLDIDQDLSALLEGGGTRAARGLRPHPRAGEDPHLLQRALQHPERAPDQPLR